MKKSIFTLFAILMAVFIIQGCDKAHLTDLGLKGKLIASKTELKVSQLDTILCTGAGSTDSLTWTVSPDGKDILHARGNAATIVFSDAGEYVVTAKKADGTSANVTIIVTADSNSVYHEDTQNTNTNVSATNDTTTYEPITGDLKVHFSAGYATSDFNSYTANGDLGATTTCTTGIIQYTATVDASQNYNIDVVNIREHTNCANPASAGTERWVSQIFPHKLINLGTHQLKITLNGTTYTGSFTVTDKSVTINWPYTSGVIMESQLYYEYR